MPFFGLVWVASWMGCFLPSSQDLLKVPNPLPGVLALLQAPSPHSACLPTVPFTGALANVVRSTLHPVELPPLHPPLGLLQGIFHKIRGRERPSGSEVEILPVPAGPLNQKPLNQKQDVRQTGSGLDQCLPASFTSVPSPVSPVFQIRVRQHLVAEVGNSQQAIQLAQRLEQLVTDEILDNSQLQPALINGLPAGKVGERTLFTIDHTIAQRWNCNPELLAIKWVNNLRTALEHPPLPLALAQATMHRLQETGEYLEGEASWYGPHFHGQQTATGETFDQNQLTAAHPSLPFDTYLKVTNLNNGKSVIVRVNDRGPYCNDRTLDLSREAARQIDSEKLGVVPIEAAVMQPAIASLTSESLSSESPSSESPSSESFPAVPLSEQTLARLQSNPVRQNDVAAIVK